MTAKRLVLEAKGLAPYTTTTENIRRHGELHEEAKVEVRVPVGSRNEVGMVLGVAEG